MKISNLLDKDFKIIEKKKIWFIIPACVVAVAIVMMIVFGVTTGEPLNLGMDFQGGYTVSIQLSTKLNDDTFDMYSNDVKDIIQNLKDEDGNNYGLKVAGIQRQGKAESASLYVKYKAAPGADDNKMNDEINPAVEAALSKVFRIVPAVETSSTSYTVTYRDFPLVEDTYNKKVKLIEKFAEENGISATGFAFGENKQVITFSVSQANEKFASGLAEVLTINDKYSGQAKKGDSISATISGELLTNAILAISLAIVLMLVYIAFRFEVSSGLSAIVALIHDLLIMFSFMAIFHIEISSTFIAALITILGYSINNTIIVFDRIRENKKSLYYKNSTATFVANQSIKETLMRSVNTSITTLLTITMVAIIGVSAIRVFALPIIVGLLAGTFSSIFISPSVWAMWKDRKRKSDPEKARNKEGKKAAVA